MHLERPVEPTEEAGCSAEPSLHPAAATGGPSWFDLGYGEGPSPPPAAATGEPSWFDVSPGFSAALNLLEQVLPFTSGLGVVDTLPGDERADRPIAKSGEAPPVAAGGRAAPVPSGKRSAADMEGSAEPRPGSPPPTRSRDQSCNSGPGPVFRLCQHLDGLSRVNDECSPWLEELGDDVVERVGLPDLDDDVWAVLNLRTSLRDSFSLYVRWSRESRFAENTLCMRQLVICGAIIGPYLSPPRIQLADRVFPLVQNPREGDSLVIDELFPLNQGWTGDYVRHPRLFDRPDLFLCLPLCKCELPFDIVRDPQVE